jgi:probable rRNA maturation factor
MPVSSPRRRKVAPLELSIHCSEARQFSGFLRRHLIAAHLIISPPLQRLSLALVTAAEMRRLHYKYLSRREVTDVLTFELARDSRKRVIEGEIIICPAAARRVVGNRSDKLGRELLLYALHGMLHLCSLDDRTDRGFRVMHETEDQILIRLGVGPVFDPGKRAERRKSAPSRSGAGR